MAFIIWEEFTKEWLRRARRRTRLDDGDRFIALWIAFSGWMRVKYGELPEPELLCKTGKNEALDAFFNSLKKENLNFTRLLNQLTGRPIPNMRFTHLEETDKTYDGSLASLIGVIYNIRCNLFHGRKDISERGKDYELVGLSYRILRHLFFEYLKQHEPDFVSD